MKNCIVVGRVIPERANVQFHVPKFEFSYSNLSGSGTAFAEFSQVSINLRFEKDCDNLAIVASIARSIVAPVSNYIAFTQTASYYIALDMIVDVDAGRHYSVSASEPFFSVEAEPPNTFSKKQEHDITVIPNFVTDPVLQRVLDDLGNALRYPQLSPMYCRLAIETLRSSFDPTNEANAWAMIRNALNIRRETIDTFWKLAADQRHGRIVDHTWDERKACLRTTWEIVNRYVLYKSDPAFHFDPL
jgi:hypothetical protein